MQGFPAVPLVTVVEGLPFDVEVTLAVVLVLLVLLVPPPAPPSWSPGTQPAANPSKTNRKTPNCVVILTFDPFAVCALRFELCVSLPNAMNHCSRA